MHYDGQLRASHLILGCVPFYTSYQNLSIALMVGSPLLSYLDVQLPNFLPKGLTSKEARDLGPRLVRHDYLEPIQDDSRDTIFQGHVEHVPVDAPPLGDPDEEDLLAEETNSTLLTPTKEIVKKRSMALDRWFPAVQALGVQALTLPTP